MAWLVDVEASRRDSANIIFPLSVVSPIPFAFKNTFDTSTLPSVVFISIRSVASVRYVEN